MHERHSFNRTRGVAEYTLLRLGCIPHGASFAAANSTCLRFIPSRAAITASREEIVATSVVWVAIELNVLPESWAGCLDKFLWRAYWATELECSSV
jgi:hypothetical protein